MSVAPTGGEYPRTSSHSTKRYYIKKGHGGNDGSELLADLGETNCGDPKVICDYIGTSIQNYPAEKTMLVLWNHGSGYYVPPDWTNTDGSATDREIQRSNVTAVMKRSFFSTTRKELLTLPSAGKRGICYDDQSNDCLDNRELKQVLRFTQDRLAGRKLEILGMDACLMTMIEVAYQVKDYARFLVGSEESEPADGWPYDTILADLTSNPTMDGEKLAKIIVDRYAASYEPGNKDITQAALDLSKLGDVTAALGDLAKAILKGPMTEIEDAIWLARRPATSFYNNMYVDIHHFAKNIAAKVEAGAVRSAALGVVRAIEGNGATSPIIAERHAGPHMNAVKGLSIYWPLTQKPSTFYQNLDFAAATKWGDLLDAFGIG